MATALLTALASTSISAQTTTPPVASTWSGSYFDYGPNVASGNVANVGGLASGLYYQSGSLSGLWIQGVDKAITDIEIGAGSATGVVGFATGKPTPSQVVPVGGASNYSVLIVGSEVNGAQAAGINIVLTKATVGTAPQGLTTLTGLTLLGSGILNFKDNQEKNLTIKLGATGSTSALAGLDLVGLDLSAGGKYTGGTSISATDTITLFATDSNGKGGNATAINVGTGTFTIGGGTSDIGVSASATAYASVQNTKGLYAYGASIAGGTLADVQQTTGTSITGAVDVSAEFTGNTSKAVSNAAGVVMSAGAINLNTATANKVTMTGTVTTGAKYTGEANAYGAYLTGGALKVDPGAGASITTTIQGSITQVSGAYTGSGTAAGIYATGADVNIDLSQAAGGTLAIAGSVGSASGGATGNVSAYGIFASGAGTSIVITGPAATGFAISGTVNDASSNPLKAVSQTAAGIWAVDTSVTINGNAATDNVITITGEDDNTYAADTTGTVSVYGIYASNATLNLTGQVTFSTKTNGTGDQFNIAALSANNDTTINITGYTTNEKGVKTQVNNTNGTVVTLSTQSVINGGTLNVLAGDGSDSQAGGNAKLSLGTSAALTSTGANINVIAGAANATENQTGGNADITLGTNTTITGGEFQIQGGIGGSQANGGSATVTLGSGATTLSGVTLTLTGANSGGTKQGGSAALNSATASTDLIIKDNSTIELIGGAKTDNAGTAGTASIDLTQGTNSTSVLTLGTQNAVDNSSISIGSGGSLKINKGTAYEGTSITVGVGGSLNAGTGLTIDDGAKLVLTKGATKVEGTSTIKGTLYINGTSEQSETPDDGSGPYQSGFGTMQIEGEVLTEDPALYITLNTNDAVTFADGSSMDAAQVNVGTIASNTATMVIDGGEISIGELKIGNGSTTSSVTLSDGILTLGAPELNDDGETYTSSLTVNNSSSFNISGGLLITDSYNLWNENPAETATGLTNAYGLGTFGHNGGSIEITNSKVDMAWLALAQKAVSNTIIVVDGTLYQEVDGKEVPVTLYPKTPADGDLPTNGVGLEQVSSDMLLGTALNAQTYTPPKQTATKKVTFQNLVIGSVPTTLPWSTQGTNTVWNIATGGADKTVGFQKILLGDGDNILVAGDQTLVLTGDGDSIVSANNPVNLYVGTQNIAATQGGSTGNLELGYTTSDVAQGGSLDGNIYVYNGTMSVSYNDYTVTGNLTLGQAQGKTEAGKAISPTPGSLDISQGSLTVQTIDGQNVGTATIPGINLTGGAQLNVGQGMSVKLVALTAGDEFAVDESTLSVGQALEIQAAVAASPVDFGADGSQISVGTDFTATDTNIDLTDSSMFVGGNFTQAPSASKTPNGLTLNITGKGDTTVTIGGKFTTNATKVTVEDSAIEVTGDMLISAPEATTVTPVTLTLDGAKLQAANISLTNVNTQATGTAANPFQEATINTDGALALKSSKIELDAGQVNAASVSVDKASTLTFGMSQDDLSKLNKALETAGKPAVTDPLVVTAQLGDVTLAGPMVITGAGTDAVGSEQTEVAMQSLTFSPDEGYKGAVTVSGDASLMIGSTDIAKTMTNDMDAVDDFLTKNNIDAENVTNYLVMGNTVKMNPANAFTVNGDTGLSIGAGTGVAIDTTLFAANQALTKDAEGNTVATLFAYKPAPVADGATAPTATAATISPDAYFVVVKPLGNMKINVAEGFSGDQTVSDDNVGTTNPLYDVQWYVDPAQDAGILQLANADETAEPVNSTILAVAIDQEEVRTNFPTIAPESLINASQRGYDPNQAADEGGNLLLNIISDITDPSQYAAAAQQINSIALRGAAAHAHEIGISAASMVVDSVWDHGSKLAAAPHEEAKGDLWITLDWNHSRANDYKAAGLDNGYKLDLYGATFGADYDFANGLAAGLAVSVGGGDAKSKGFNDGQKTDVTYWGINLYGTYASPFVNVIGNVGYIGIKNKTKVGGDKGRPDANIWTIGVKAEKDFAINEQFTVTPHVGIRYLSVDVDDFNLKGFHYGTDKANLVQFPIGVAFAANLKTANGAAVKPFLDLSFVPTAGDKKVDNTFGITGGSARDVIDTTIASTSMFQGKIGVNASYGAHNFGLNFAIGGGNKGRLDTGLQAKYRFVF